jgi:hypothetical protein
MLGTGASRLPTYTTERPTYTVVTNTQVSPSNKPSGGERIIPIETTTSPFRV